MRVVIAMICALALAGCATMGPPPNKKQDRIYSKNTSLITKTVAPQPVVIQPNPKPVKKPHWWSRSKKQQQP